MILDPTTGKIRKYNEETDAFNASRYSYLVTPQEIYNLFSSANYTIIDDKTLSSLNIFGQVNFSNRTSDQQMALAGQPVLTTEGGQMRKYIMDLPVTSEQITC